MVDELVCKPGPVPGGLSAVPFGDHPSRRAVADTLQRFTRRLGRAALERLRTPDRHSRCRSGALNLAPGGVYRAVPVTRHAGGLLHHRFTLTPRSAPPGGVVVRVAVCFLWHCPAARAGLPLTTTLPCGARTFLGGPPQAVVRRGRPTNSSALDSTVGRLRKLPATAAGDGDVATGRASWQALGLQPMLLGRRRSCSDAPRTRLLRLQPSSRLPG